jgi:hypothetical protein
MIDRVAVHPAVQADVDAMPLFAALSQKAGEVGLIEPGESAPGVAA